MTDQYTENFAAVNHTCEWNETRQCLAASRDDKCYTISQLKDSRCADFGKSANMVNDLSKALSNFTSEISNIITESM
jgi:hypothetical protein